MDGNVFSLEARHRDLDLRVARANGRDVLHVDSESELGCLRVQIVDREHKVVCERLVRSVPGALTIPVLPSGRYAISVQPVRLVA
jgi:hypothetical protein